jgi:hypothetical protein
MLVGNLNREFFNQLSNGWKDRGGMREFREDHEPDGQERRGPGYG